MLVGLQHMVWVILVGLGSCSVGGMLVQARRGGDGHDRSENCHCVWTSWGPEYGCLLSARSHALPCTVSSCVVTAAALLCPLQPSEIRWASRWDTYLMMMDDQIHWFSIINSLMIVLFLSGKWPWTDAGGYILDRQGVVLPVARRCTGLLLFTTSLNEQPRGSSAASGSI